MQVVEHEHERAVRGDRGEQRADGAVRAVALVRRPGAAAARVVERRQHLGQLGRQRVVPAGPARQVRGHDVGVERVGPDAERDVALELGGCPREHELSPPAGALAQLGQEPRLPDARLAADRQAGATALPERGQCRIDLLQLGAAPDDVGVRDHPGASLRENRAPIP